MRVKPTNVFLSETPWKVGDKVKVIGTDGFEWLYPLSKVFTLVGGEDCAFIPGNLNGYSAKLELVEEKGQLEFDF